jgi:hypothetical protein
VQAHECCAHAGQWGSRESGSACVDADTCQVAILCARGSAAARPMPQIRSVGEACGSGGRGGGSASAAPDDRAEQRDGGGEVLSTYMDLIYLPTGCAAGEYEGGVAVLRNTVSYCITSTRSLSPVPRSLERNSWFCENLSRLPLYTMSSHTCRVSQVSRQIIIRFSAHIERRHMQKIY